MIEMINPTKWWKKSLNELSPLKYTILKGLCLFREGKGFQGIYKNTLTAPQSRFSTASDLDILQVWSSTIKRLKKSLVH